MTDREISNALLTLAVLNLCLSLPLPVAAQTVTRPTPYPLQSWKNITCRSKGRFQDREYCSSAIIDRVVADGKPAIPVLISQITDSRKIPGSVYDFWPSVSVGELAYFILADLFLDETWTKSTMPVLFAQGNCNDPAWVCWDEFRKTHSLKVLQARWQEFWRVNQNQISWDGKARCFRLAKVDRAKH